MGFFSDDSDQVRPWQLFIVVLFAHRSVGSSLGPSEQRSSQGWALPWTARCCRLLRGLSCFSFADSTWVLISLCLQAAKAYEKHVADNGEPDSHATRNELLATFAGGFIDRIVETKGVSSRRCCYLPQILIFFPARLHRQGEGTVQRKEAARSSILNDLNTSNRMYIHIYVI